MNSLFMHAVELAQFFGFDGYATDPRFATWEPDWSGEAGHTDFYVHIEGMKRGTWAWSFRNQMVIEIDRHYLLSKKESYVIGLHQPTRKATCAEEREISAWLAAYADIHSWRIHREPADFIEAAVRGFRWAEIAEMALFNLDALQIATAEIMHGEDAAIMAWHLDHAINRISNGVIHTSRWGYHQVAFSRAEFQTILNSEGATENILKSSMTLPANWNDIFVHFTRAYKRRLAEEKNE